MISVLNAGNWAEQYSTIGERAFLSITMTVVGIAIVVFILALLSIVVSFMSRLINGKPEKEDTTALIPQPAAVQPASTAGPEEEETKTAAQSVSENDDALIAAITAAVSLVLSDSSQPSAGFKIRRIRRV